jgi:hypothetical protein
MVTEASLFKLKRQERCAPIAAQGIAAAHVE